MPPRLVLGAVGVLLLAAVWSGYRVLTAFLTLRSVPPAAESPPDSLVEGAKMALTGEVVVDDVATRGATTVDDADQAVGAYWDSATIRSPRLFTLNEEHASDDKRAADDRND